MEKNKKTYSNSIRSEESIKEALIHLLSKGHDLNSITVKDLSNEAGLTRGTFYNHFSGITDVVLALEDDFMKRLSTALEETNLNDEEARKNFFMKIEGFLGESSSNLKVMAFCVPLSLFKDIKANINKTIEATMLKKLQGYDKDPALQSRIRFFVNGLSGSYVDSVLDPKGPSIHETSLEGFEISNIFFSSQNKPE